MGFVMARAAVDLGQYREDGTHVVLSSNSMTACIDLLHGSDAVLPYPEIMEGFFAARGIAMLDVVESEGAIPIGVYS